MINILRRARTIPAHFYLLPFLLFVIIPGYILTESMVDLANYRPEIFIVLGSLAAISFVVILTIGIGTSRLKFDLYFSEIIEFFFFYVVVSGFLLPASASTGMVDPELAEINLQNLILALLAAFGLFIVSRTKLHNALYQILIVYIFINAALISQTIYGATISKAPQDDLYGLSSTRNVLVLSFDGISRTAVTELLEEVPEIKKEFEAFTFFDRVVSTSPATSASTATSLYGNKNYKADFRSVRQLWDSEPANLVTNLLQSTDYDVVTSGIYSLNFVNRNRIIIGSHDVIDGHKIVNLLNYSIARTLTNIFVLRGRISDLAGKTINLIYNSINTNAVVNMAATSDQHSAFLEDVQNSMSPKWKKRLAVTALDYEKYVSMLHISGTRPSAQFVHFTHTHFPVELDRDCKYRSIESDWYKSRQNYAGAKEEAHCALGQIATFLRKIKEIGAFENSLIVLKSDHGKPGGYNKPSSIESFGINGNRQWGFGRYTPFLAIKNFGPGASGVTRNKEPVTLDDLAKTICVNSISGGSCDAYSGYDLLDKNLSISETETLTLFIAKSSDSTFHYSTHIPISVPRQPDVLKNLHAALSGKLLTDSPECSMYINVEDFQPLNNGYTDSKSWLTWIDSDTTFVRFRSESSCPLSRVSIHIKRDSQSFEDYSFRINGQTIKAIENTFDDKVYGDHIIVDLPYARHQVHADILVEILHDSTRDSVAPAIEGFEVN